MYRCFPESEFSELCLFLGSEISKLFGVCVQDLSLSCLRHCVLGSKGSGVFSALCSRVSQQLGGPCLRYEVLE